MFFRIRCLLNQLFSAETVRLGVLSFNLARKEGGKFHAKSRSMKSHARGHLLIGVQKVFRHGKREPHGQIALIQREVRKFKKVAPVRSRKGVRNGSR